MIQLIPALLSKFRQVQRLHLLEAPQEHLLLQFTLSCCGSHQAQEQVSGEDRAILLEDFKNFMHACS